MLVRQEFARQLPLPLGEGWGEGLAEKDEERTLSSLFFASQGRSSDEKVTKRLWLAAKPSPRPFPGRGRTSRKELDSA